MNRHSPAEPATVISLARAAGRAGLGHGPNRALTLAELLTTATLRAAKPEVLSGHGRLEIPIRWVHAGEWVDVESLLHGSELLLTTGLSVRNSDADQVRFIDLAHQRGVVGLVLELGDVHRQAPTAMVARARELELPLVLLHRPVRFVDITEFAHRRILGVCRSWPRRADHIHRELLTAMLDGADTAMLMCMLAERLGTSVILERPDGTQIFHASAGGRVGQLRSSARLRAGAVCHRAAPQSSDSVPVPGPADRVSFRLTLPRSAGRLLSTSERDVLVRAADLLGLALTRRREEELLRAREAGGFLIALISDELAGCEAEDVAVEFGWAGPGCLLPLLVSGRTSSEVATQQESWSAILRDAQRDLAGYGIWMLGGLIDPGDRVAAVVGFRKRRSHGLDDERRREVAARVSSAIHLQVARYLPAGRPVVVWAGEVAEDWRQIGGRLGELVDMATSSTSPARAGSQGWVDLAKLDVDLLLERLGENDALRRFADRRLGPIEAHDQRCNTNLMRTLAMLFDNNLNKADTARALFLQRQSLYSRLKRIEDLLGESLSEPSARMGLQLALRIRAIESERS